MEKKNGSCWLCVKIFKWIPVIFIVSVVSWSYWAYVVQLCYESIDNKIQKAFYLLFFHLALLMFLWSYWQTIFTDLIKVPDRFRVPDVEIEKLQQAKNEDMQNQILERFGQNLPVVNRTIKGALRFCEKCQLIKPDRAHHCKCCDTCVLKMDHHCPWINNCVAFHNYKFFMLFLAYALFYCFFITITAFQHSLNFFKNEPVLEKKNIHILLVFCSALVFTISLTSLFSYHCYLVIKNRSTLETFRPPIFRTGKDKDGFSLGKYNNFQEVFGVNPWHWFIPIFTSLGNGVTYPVRSQHQSILNTYNSMSSTQNRSEFDQMSLVEEATILALGTGTAVIGPTTDVPLMESMETV